MAIVLVLVAIAVPVFTGATAYTQEATWAGNRHTMKVIVADSYMLNTSIVVDTTYVQEVAEKLERENSYLKFKGYTNNLNHAFVYAGMQKDLDKNDWQSRCICDSAGTYGTAGQWYELPEVVGLTTIANNQDFKNLLATGKR